MSWADSSGSPRRSPVPRGGPTNLAVRDRSSSPSPWTERAASSSVLQASPRTPPHRAAGRSSPPQPSRDAAAGASLSVEAGGAEAASSLENQQLLSGLVDAQRLAPAIKTVIDRSWQGSFHSMLEAHVDRKNQEIKNICNRHYEEFISSIDHLITVKSDLTELKGMLAQHNQGVQDSGAALLENARRLVEYRVIRRNIDLALEVCAKCNYIVSLAIKAQSQIVDKKYFSALKTLDQLQRLHLPRFSDYEFAHLLEQQLPLMILRIKEDVRAEFSSWHSSIRQRSQDKDLGAAAMTQLYEQLQVEDQKKEAQRKERAKRLGRGLQMGELDEKDFDDDEPIRPSRDRAGSDPPEEDPDDPVAARGSVKVSANGADSLDDKGLFERLGIDFAPVYQCLHIYENLNIGAQFQQYYRDSRRAHALQAVELPPMSSGEFIAQYTPYFAQLAGFFIIEDNIMKSGNELMTRQQVDSLWDLAVTKIKVVLREHFGYLTDPIVFNQVKYMAVLFCKTMESYGYNPTLLLEFLADQRAVFETILTQRLQREVLQILDAEKFESMPINTSAEYEKLVLNYHLQDRAMPIHLPARMPFSASVPQICRQIRIFVADYFEFAAHLNADMDAAIRKAVDDALINVVNGSMSHAIDQSAQLHISQAVQFSINAAFLVEACSFFETHTLSYLDTRYPKSFRLQARTVFQQTRMRCEDLLYELIDNKIDSFMSLAVNFKWNPNQPQTEASDYIQDLVAYLETTFACLSFMPPNVRDAVHFTSCKHIASSLMNQMVGPAVKTFNVIAMYNLHQDLQLLENFAQRCNSPNLIESFSEPRQLVNLFLSGNVEQMLDQHVRSTRFQNLSLTRLTKIMDKYRDIGMFATMPLAIKKLKAKQVEVVSKQLKMLVES